MAIVMRRVFYGKIGAADRLVEHHKAGLELLAKHGYPMKGRVLSDHESGRSDQVAVEWEVDSMADYEGALAGLMSNAEAAREFGSWEEQLGEMIHYSVAEQWTLH